MSSRATIRITTHNKDSLRINYARRMYAIIRRYTPEAIEGGKNECFAELTGLRTFFKMTYKEIAEKILEDLVAELGVRCRFTVLTSSVYDRAKGRTVTQKTISTYQEINSLFVGKAYVSPKKRTPLRKGVAVKKVRLTVPFLGKVA